MQTMWNKSIFVAKIALKFQRKNIKKKNRFSNAVFISKLFCEFYLVLLWLYRLILPFFITFDVDFIYMVHGRRLTELVLIDAIIELLFWNDNVFIAT